MKAVFKSIFSFNGSIAMYMQLNIFRRATEFPFLWTSVNFSVYFRLALNITRGGKPSILRTYTHFIFLPLRALWQCLFIPVFVILGSLNSMEMCSAASLSLPPLHSTFSSLLLNSLPNPLNKKENFFLRFLFLRSKVRWARKKGLSQASFLLKQSAKLFPSLLFLKKSAE